MAILNLKLGKIRLRVRDLMILVALVAILFFLGIRLTRYQYRYKFMLEQEEYYRTTVPELEAQLEDLSKQINRPGRKVDETGLKAIENTRLEIQDYRAMAKWSKELVVKYERARRIPWMDVTKDPVLTVNFFVRRTPW